MSVGLFVGLDNAMMNGFTAILVGQTALYSTMVAGLAGGSVTLYILWRGYQTLAGKLQTPVEDVVWDLARMAIILTFALNSDSYLDATIAAINGLKDGLSGSESVWVLLDTAWEKAQAIGTRLWVLDNSTFSILGPIAEYTVWAGVGFMLVVSALVNLTAELTLMLMTTTAPIFIFCLMFGWLRPMFNNWVQTIFSVLLTVLFSSLALRVAMNYLNSILEQARVQADTANIVTLAVQCCISAICCGFVVLLSAKLAGALAGSAVQGTIQGMATGAAMGSLKKGLNIAKPVAVGAGNTAGRIGDQAAKNLKGPQAKQSANQARSKAAVENMKRQSN